MRVVKIATMGRQDYAQWVTQYFVTYSQDGASFAEYKENSNRKVRTPLTNLNQLVKDFTAAKRLSASHRQS